MPVLGQLLVGHHGPRQVRFAEALLPEAVAKLRRGYDQHVLSEVPSVFPDELDADLRLAHAHAVGVEDAAVAIQNPLRPCQPVPLESREGVQVRERYIVVQLTLVEFEQRPEKHSLGIALQGRRSQ